MVRPELLHGLDTEALNNRQETQLKVKMSRFPLGVT